MKRKILSILLCIAVCITMMPVAAYAEDISTGITIAGTKVTSVGSVTGVSGVSYNVENGNRILTLENAKIDGQIRITSGGGVTIKIIGENTITGPTGNTNEDSAIYSPYYSLTISGDGSDARLQVTSSRSTAIYCGSNISFKNVKVTAIGASGIESKNGSVKIEQSVISSRLMRTATGIIGNDIELTNADISTPEFISEETKSLSSANSGLFTIDNQIVDYQLELFMEVNVTSRNVDNLPYLYKKSGVSVSENLRGELSYAPESSTLTLTKALNTYKFNYGTASAIIKSGAPLTISLNDENTLKNLGEGGVISAAEPLRITGAGSLSAESENSFAIKCEKNLNVTGGTITAIGKTHAIESESITISGGTIKAKITSNQDNIVIRAANPIAAADGKMLKLTNCEEVAPGEIQITDGAEFAEISVSENHTHAYNSEKWDMNEKQHWHACTTDGCAQLEAADHNFGDWTATKEATSTEKGSKERICLTCKYKETAEIPVGGTVNGIAINPQNFPDENFKTIVTGFDTDKNGYLSAAEISKVRKIDCKEKGISNLAGIEFFTALTNLDCKYNELTSLDVSQNDKLTTLYCQNNLLTTLDISKNAALKNFSCNDNLLASLDVSKNVNLDWLNCSSNLLTALDISKNILLTHLNCSNNRLTALDTSKNTALDSLMCTSNVYPIILTKDRTFDLSKLPNGFVPSKASNWDGGSVRGNILTVDDDADEVTYTYDCGGNQTVEFVLKVDGVLAGPISLPVRTIESENDTDYVLRSNLSASFTPVGPATANTDELNSYGGARIDYIHPAAATPEAGYTKHAMYQIYIPLTAYTADTISGILTLPLPSNFDGASAKLIKHSSEDKITITNAGGGSITLNTELKKESDPNLSNTFSVIFAVQYKEASSGGSSSSGGSYTPVQKPDVQPVSGGKTELSKDGSTLEITPDEGMEIGTVTVNGKEVTVKDGKLTGLKTGDKVEITFIAKAPTKAENDKKASAKVKKLSLKVKTSKDANKNIKAIVQTDKALAAVIKELKAAGYTVKYKFYRSEKKASDYKRMLIKNTRSYLNTTGSEDTHYYYKVRLAIYDKNGKLVAQTALKQCDAGHRTWTK